MRYRVIKVSRETKISVVGDIHEHNKQFKKIVEKISPNENHLLVSVGDIYDKGYGEQASNEIIDALIEMNNQGIGFMVQGNHESKKIRRTENPCDRLKWVNYQPYVISFVYPEGSRVTVMHAGVTKRHTYEDLKTNNEVMYVRCLDEAGDYIPLRKTTIDGRVTWRPEKPGKPWHEMYDGRFGYIISGHDAQQDGKIKFYKYSANIDTRCYDTGILSAITMNMMGRENVIQVEDEAANKNGRLYNNRHDNLCGNG